MESCKVEGPKEEKQKQIHLINAIISEGKNIFWPWHSVHVNRQALELIIDVSSVHIHIINAGT